MELLNRGRRYLNWLFALVFAPSSVTLASHSLLLSCLWLFSCFLMFQCTIAFFAASHGEGSSVNVNLGQPSYTLC